MCFACRTELIIFTVVIIAVCSYIAMLPATHVIFVKERSKDREWSSFTGQVHRVAEEMEEQQDVLDAVITWIQAEDLHLGPKTMIACTRPGYFRSFKFWSAWFRRSIICYETDVGSDETLVGGMLKQSHWFVVSKYGYKSGYFSMETCTWTRLENRRCTEHPMVKVNEKGQYVLLAYRL